MVRVFGLVRRRWLENATSLLCRSTRRGRWQRVRWRKSVQYDMRVSDRFIAPGSKLIIISAQVDCPDCKRQCDRGTLSADCTRCTCEDHVITGFIRDEQNNPIAGASIYKYGHYDLVAQTDRGGRYRSELITLTRFRAKTTTTRLDIFLQLFDNSELRSCVPIRRTTSCLSRKRASTQSIFGQLSPLMTRHVPPPMAYSSD